MLDLLAAVVAIGLLTLVAADRHGVPRILLSLVFLCFVPGRAVVSNWPRLAQWSEAAMSLVLSLTVLALTATVTLWAHRWHPLGLFEVEAVASLAALIVGALRRRARAARTPARTPARRAGP